MQPFESTKAFLSYATSAATALKRSDGDLLVFRGEPRIYDSMLPSLYRQPEGNRLHWQTLVSNLAMHLLDDLLTPALQMKAVDSNYKGEWLGGDLNDAEEFMAYPQNPWVLWQLEALLQHYGWPTPCIDITYDPAVAAFFACLDYKNRSLITEGVGHVYIWSRSQLRSDPGLMFKAPVISLEHMARIVAELFGTVAIRPMVQRGGIIRFPWNHVNLEPMIKSHCVRVEFSRHDAAQVLKPFDHYFPQDTLLEKLDEFEGRYLDYCRKVPSHQVGETWGDFVTFLAKARDRRMAPAS
jgi:hypothetical protein